MAIKFKELKQYISRVVRISVCYRDGHYDNYSLISDIPGGADIYYLLFSFKRNRRPKY